MVKKKKEEEKKNSCHGDAVADGSGELDFGFYGPQDFRWGVEWLEL